MYGSAAIWWRGTEILSTTSSITQSIEIYELSPQTYWSAAWHWKNAPDGGYGGVQTLGHLGNNVWTDIATFSIWNADRGVPGDGANCLSFGGEGDGYSCRLPINLEAGNTYTISYSIDTARGNDWWQAKISDKKSGVTKLIGSIKAPQSNLVSQDYYNFIEYWGPPVDCNAVGPASAKFYNPISSNPNIKITYGDFTKWPQACVNAEVDAPPMNMNKSGNPTIRFGGPYQAPSTVIPDSTPLISQPRPSQTPFSSTLVTIKCTKGKLIKLVKGYNPKCPKGYKLKIS